MFLSGERRLHLSETSANRTVKKFVADTNANAADQFGIDGNDRVEFEAGELLGKRLKQAVELSGAKLKGRLDVGIGNAFGRILQLTKLTGDLRESFQTTVFR